MIRRTTTLALGSVIAIEQLCIVAALICGGSVLPKTAQAEIVQSSSSKSIKKVEWLQGKRVMAIGDSITQGSSHTSTYRYHLDTMLQDAGVRVDWVGPFDGVYQNRDGETTNPPDWDSDHAGKNGATTKSLFPLIERSIASQKPEVALIHIGTNDSAVKGIRVAKTLQYVEKTIDALRAAHPATKIYLAKIIPATKERGKRVKALNEMYENLARELSTEQSPIAIINHWSNFWQKRFIATDKIHPNKEGYQEIARRWFAGLARSPS